MYRNKFRVIAATVACLSTAPALAQETVAPPTPTPPVTTPPVATPPATTPPATTAPPAATTAPATPPAATTTPATPPAGGAQAPAAQPQSAPADQPKLPEVEIIQEKPKVEPKPEPIEEAAPKPKKKPAPVVEDVPTPPPAKKVASKPKPKPVQQAAPQPAPEPQPVVEQAPAEPVYAQPLPANQVRMSPVGGSEIPIEKVPGGVSTVSAADISRDGSKIAQDVLQQRVPGIIIGDAQGNAFQTNVQYRGFEASPVNGMPQGLAVYQNGVRINESFGDIVNWDFLPSVAINDITVMSGNPVFGLNAIGGAISINMKDGFNYEGAEVDTRFGSFGRKQVSVQAGKSSGGFAIYGAFEGINDDGFRDFSEAEMRRGYADIGFKSDNAEFHFNYTGAENFVGVTAAAPETLLAMDRELTFSSPQTTENTVQMFSANGRVEATKTMTFSGIVYHRSFKQKHDDGNISDAEECLDENGAPLGTLCIEGTEADENAALDANGNPIAFDDDISYGSIDRTSQDAKGYGGSIQAVEKSPLFGLGNQFLIGASYDHGHVGYTANSELGFFLPKFVVQGFGTILSGPDDVLPRDLTTINDYYGVYFSDTLDLTSQLALTVGGRYNYARIKMKENTGEPELADLNATNTFSRFNPAVGLTYKAFPGLSLYGGYSEANRAPTAAELACSDPENPCIIESFLTADPPLKQVVSHTWEAGLRGDAQLGWGAERLEWNLGLFRTLNTDDIVNSADNTAGRGVFANAGETLRQGVEASVAYRSQRLFAYASYSFTDATYRDALLFPSPDNPQAVEECPVGPDAEGEPINCINVSPGDRLPGVPRHKFKAGIDYWMTPQWKIGADLVAASSQFFYGDEANLNKPLSGYTKVNLHSSYDVTENVQVYGLIENLFDARYGLYGTFFDVEAANEAGEPSGVTFSDDNNRSIVPAIPFAAYGGVKVKF